LGSLHNKNLALLFKWLWNLNKGVALGWKDLIFQKYQPKFTNGLSMFAGSLSPTWRGMVSSISLNESIIIPLHSISGSRWVMAETSSSKVINKLCKCV
jgi:hypothetical protein